jgi:diadenosine tetraphosphate (Ap4A) HIT family hydrolase
MARCRAVTENVRRAQLDLEDYARRSQANPCFICMIVDGSHHFPHGEIYRDDFAIVFLNRFPTLLGYTLIAPLDHRVSVIDDFTEHEHLRIQTLVHRVGRAIAATVLTERLYVMSLGSNQGNAHVHWHIAPLPPGVPYEEQQFAALMMETKGYIDLTLTEHDELAGRIRSSLSAQCALENPDHPPR